MLETIARRPAPETLTIENGPAVFEARDGTRIAGTAAADVSRASIALRFRPSGDVGAGKAAYGEPGARIAAADCAWTAGQMSYCGVAPEGAHRFGTMALTVARQSGRSAAITRLVVAGGAWRGAGFVDGRHVIAEPLSRDVVSHHDLRMSIVIEGSLGEPAVAAMERASAFVSGIDVELLAVERYSADGELEEIEHRRGYRRLGRGPHSPFTNVPDADRMRAWIAVVAAYPRLLGSGVPIDLILDQISAHNQVAQIHVSAQLLLLATATAAYHRLHGDAVGVASASRREELACLDRALHLGLSEQDFDRYEALRVELLDTGFFHKPGYETGRPQQDIKFLRDLAHTIVFRLCGYSGPVYGAERFAVREL